MSDIEESYKDTIIGHLGNSGTADLLLHTVKCWHACAVNEENQALYMVLNCSHMIYKCYSRIGFTPIKHNKEKNHNEIFNIIPQLTKNRLHVDCLQDGFFMYNNKLILSKVEVINPIPDYLKPEDCCKKNHPLLFKKLMT